MEHRDVAQLVEYASGGRVVAGSSPVIPTLKETRSRVLRVFLSLRTKKNRFAPWITNLNVIGKSSCG